jgi:hypothetical protein
MIWMARLTAFAVLLQNLEMLQLRSALAAEGGWDWALVRRDFAGLPRVVRAGLDALLNEKSFYIGLEIQVVVALLAFAFPQAIFFAFLALGTWLSAVRWRGTFNGGADTLTLILLVCLTVGLGAVPGSARARGALWFVALQVVLSYFVAGVVKLRRGEWRQGTALGRILGESAYDVPARLRGWAGYPILMATGAWALLFFEVSFPLALRDPSWCRVYLLAAFAFHLLNFVTFGLNRFVWAWLAAYPALYLCSGGVLN